MHACTYTCTQCGHRDATLLTAEEATYVVLQQDGDTEQRPRGPVPRGKNIIQTGGRVQRRGIQGDDCIGVVVEGLDAGHKGRDDGGAGRQARVEGVVGRCYGCFSRVEALG